MFDALYKWLNTTSLSQFMQGSTYTFPLVEVVHLIGITMFLGAVIAVCLRLLGLGIKQPASTIHEGLATWTTISFAIVVITGILMIIAEPIKLSNNSMWGYKVAVLAIGFVLHFAGYLMIVKPGRAEASPGLAKAIAVAILAAWFISGIGGRFIGFV